MDRDRRIQKFVRQVLGCTCPDKVFEQIEERRVAAPGLPHSRCFTIGGRLLVYIWEVADTEQFGKKFHAMLAAGRNERDERNLNRFRAVIAVDENTAAIAADATLHFSEFAGEDDRIHFHVIPQDILADL